MADIKDLLGNNLTVELVKSSKARQLVILSAGAMKLMPDNKNKINFLVEYEMKQINWLPNRFSLRAIAQKFGTETNLWIGKSIPFELTTMNGKECVIAKWI